MRNQSVSDFVAAAMDAVLKSQEHKSLFGTQYKFASDLNDAMDKCAKCKKDKDSCMCDSSMADDNDEKVSSAFDVAIDSLLTASAALDNVGLVRGASLSLKLASLVVEAKKKEKDSKKSKKDSKKDSKDSKKSDTHSAKDKKSDSKDSKKSDSKKDSKKDDKKSSKK